ncbi:MAG: threonine dehydratase [Gaiellales bacterium]|nr:threonine dehydratase [Gaiellales bacterium]
MLFELDDLRHAETVVRSHFPPTPQYVWPLLCEVVGAGQDPVEVWVKHENHTPIGAFKVRGGLVYLERLARERPGVAGIVSATRGNHGQSLAYAGRAFGIPVVILVPHGNSVEKNAAMRGFGAELVEYGRDFQEAREHAAVIAVERGFELVPPFQRDLARGVGTYALELFSAVADLDAVYVPVGMGSGITSLVTVRDLFGLHTEIVGVVSERAPATALSLEAGTVVGTPEAATFVDGVACREPDAEAIATMIAGGARIVAVSEDAVADAMRTLHRTTHNTAEPAGAIALAGLLAERARRAGQRVAVVLSGGNVDLTVLADVLAGRTPSAR